ncbi:hypothetical protein FRC03_001521 [Tulasnella sp. 419]|nr:hypothetical protein FRC03_001521 [Tulasnella sp. 419]
MEEELELWFRNPLDVIREIMSNAALAKDMTYKPVKVFNASRSEKYYKEMWTAEWWWLIQSIGGLTEFSLSLRVTNYQRNIMAIHDTTSAHLSFQRPFDYSYLI